MSSDVKVKVEAFDVAPRGKNWIDWLNDHPLFLIALSALGFATQALFVKLLVIEGEFGSFEIVLVRGVCQASGVAVVLVSWGEPVKTWLGESRTEQLLLFMRGFFGYGGIAFAFLAIQKTSLANAQVAAQTTPVFAAILSHHFLHEHWLVTERLATLGAIIGVVLVFRPPFMFGSSDQISMSDIVGIAYSLVSSLCAAVAYILIRYMGTSLVIPWPKLMLSQAVGQFTMSAPLLYAFHQHWVLPSPQQALYLASCGVLGFLSQVCMTYGMQRTKSSVGALFRQTGVVYTFMYQLLLVPSETIALSTYIGAAVITLSVGALGYWKSIASTPKSSQAFSPSPPENYSRASSDAHSEGLLVDWSGPSQSRSTLLQMVPPLSTFGYSKLDHEEALNGASLTEAEDSSEDDSDTDFVV